MAQHIITFCLPERGNENNLNLIIPSTKDRISPTLHHCATTPIIILYYIIQLYIFNSDDIHPLRDIKQRS